MDVFNVIAQDLRENHSLVSVHLNSANSFAVMHWLRCAKVSSCYPQSNKRTGSGIKCRHEMPVKILQNS